MKRIGAIVTGCLALAAAAMQPARAQPASGLSGVWTLNRAVSEFPPDIGFNPAWMTAPLAGAQGGDSNRGGRGGGRGGRGGGGSAAAPFAARPESYDDARLLQLLTAEARNPPVRLTITDTMSSVSFVNELGQSRTLHPDGRQESIEIQGVIVGVTAKRDGDELIVSYRGGQGRELRYTYSPSANPPRLTVDLQFLERGAGDKARRVYEAGPGAPPAVFTTTPAAPGAPPASGSAPAEPTDQRPGAELRGLTSLGVLVEDLGPQAIACGLTREAIETALSKPLTAAGFTVRRNSDDDTYVYVNVMTSTLPTGLCVSRYDAFLYTHGTATLSYRSAGPGAGVVDAPRRDRQQRAVSPPGRGRAWTGRLRRSVRHPDPRREQVK